MQKIEKGANRLLFVFLYLITKPDKLFALYSL